MRNPIRVAFTTPYGTAFGAIRAGGARTHQGWDLHAPEGTPIYAGPGGKVIARGYTSSYGNYADVVYPGNVHVRYAHMQDLALLMHNASWGFDKQPQLGEVGITGSAAYGNPPGSHLHVEVRILGKLVDPAKFFTTISTAGEPGDQITEEDDDDMLTQDQIRKLDEMHWLMFERIRPATDQINGIAVNVDVIRWAVADDSAGLRTMVGNLTELVRVLDAGDLSEDELADAIKAAFAPIAGPTTTEIAKAVQDEHDRREMERLKLSPPMPA
jgi:hypothetical protein